ncbi:DUF5621 domain-containing protein [Legionella fallonii]|uniref:DUF5621 domain-containing protein n=1 Tax=Legionella fallonii LLAP-10 TaxID=1212491 RepID=A0A098FZ64_9GAMM|nr:DUF5621 domain-containing protein [Legionella fallonii]CEG55523.1 protein of unknown function [Legionella fallonii LLAP-10]
MAVLTLYSYGTNEIHGVTANIISQFSSSSAETTPNKVLIMDGPDLLGRQVPVNAQLGADEIITWLKEQESEQNTINLTGFSRGSVICIRIANILKEKQKDLEKQQTLNEDDEKLLSLLKNIDLNLFLIDPVAGLTDKGNLFGRIIPDNVNNCVTILQKDERRRDFKPQDMTRIIIADPRKTKVSMLPMYGNHSDTTKIKDTQMDSGPKLLWYVLYHFLTQYGAEFQNNQIPQIISWEHETSDLPSLSSAQELLKIFSAHHAQRNYYFQSGQVGNSFFDGLPAPRTERTLQQHTKYYVRDPAFFINQLERELFKIAYPRTFNYLFEKNVFDSRFPNDSHCTQDQVIEELQRININDPLLFNRLSVRGVTKSEAEGISLNAPRGYRTLEPCATTQQIFPHLAPISIKIQSEQMNKLNLLEMEVYRLSFQYEREKSEFNFAGKRAQAARTQQLREEINDIVNNSLLNEERTENREGKYEQILDKLEQHYKELAQSNSASELTLMLERTLADHHRVYSVKQTSLLNQIVVGFIRSCFTLLKFSAGFVGHLGYAGGAILFAIGSALESIGARANELIGDLEWNPLKILATMVATTMEIVGWLIKNSFGLKPLTDSLILGIRQARDWIITTINTTTINRLESQTVDGLLLVLDELQEDAMPPLIFDAEKETNELSEQSL